LINLRHIFFLFILIPIGTFSQLKVGVLTEKQVLWYVRNYHPIAIQGSLLLDQGESTVRSARGDFDPYLKGDLNQKYFDDKEYFSILNGGLVVPTWYGIELKTGYDQNRGAFLDPENNVPDNGLWYAGISVPLGQGLIIDKRRATLRQAQIFAESTLVERQSLMNDLFFNAINQYWKWVEAWNQIQVFEEAVELAQTRFAGVKRSFEFGDVPAIDTLESLIQFQNRQISLGQARINYQKESFDLSNYLWFEENTPLEISDELQAPAYKSIELIEVGNAFDFQNRLERLPLTHPEMQLVDYKLSSLEIDRKLKAEGLKPKVNLNYNALNEPVSGDAFDQYSSQNYKWGVGFSFPLFLREQRGNLELTKLKIQDTELSRQQKLLELQNKLRSYYNEQLILDGQINLFSTTVDNYERLFEGEVQKFDSGESSLFLINSREMNLIQARLKLVELIAKYNIAIKGLGWASGNLYQN